MNFTFADVNSSFLNMVQQGLPREVMSDTGYSGSKTPLFAEKLDKTLKNTEHRVEGMPLSTKPDPVPQDPEKIIGFLSEELSRKKGINFVSSLKNIFLNLSKGDLKNVSIDADGLEALKKILLKAGFKENDINDLIAGFSEDLENKSLTLDGVFNKLLDLPFEPGSETRIEQDTFLDSSAIPFLNSILISLDIPAEKIQDIVSQADKGEKGISLDGLIEKLQALQKESFYTGSHYKTRPGNDNFRLVFKHLNLESEDAQTSSLSLDELIGSLEKLRKKVSQQSPGEALTDNKKDQGSGEKPLDLFNALFRGLKIENKPSDIQMVEFSYGQIKDQFETELLVPGNEKTNKKGLFSLKNTSQAASDTNLKNGFKGIQSLLAGKETGDFDPKNPVKENKDFLKQVKSKPAKFSDQGSLAGSNIKTGQTQPGLAILKTKATFKNLPGYVTQQVSKSLVRAINQGENILKIQLKPPELGRLVMTIDNTGNNMKVNIMTENHAAKEVLISNVNELRTVLSNSGVTLARFDVDMNSNFRQSMTDARNQTGNFSKRKQNRGKLLLDSVNAKGMNDPLSLLDALNLDGSLHFVA